MRDGFEIVPQRLRAVSRAFDTRQDRPRQLAAPLERARTVQTGDPDLDGRIDDIATQLTTLLGQFADALRQDALGLELTADIYRAVDDVAADDLSQTAADLEPGRPGHDVNPSPAT